MKHAFSCFFLVVLLSLLCFPLSAVAVSSGEALDFTSSKAEPQGDGWKWDAESRTLTLSGLEAEVTRAASRNCIFALRLPDGATIELADGSVNTITLSAAGSSSTSAYGIYSLGSISIVGNGALKVYMSGTGSSNSFGIYTTGGISISDGADVYVEGGMTGRSSNSFSAGIFAAVSLSVNKATLTASSIDDEAALVSCGINVSGPLTLSDSSVSAAGASAAEESYGIRCTGDVVVSGGSLTSVAADSSLVSSGIHSDGNLVEITGGAKVAASGSNSSVSSGISVENGLICISGDSTSVSAFGGGKLIRQSFLASSSSPQRVGGLCGGSVNISGGSVFAGSNSPTAADGDSCGAISSDGEVSISGGSIISVSNGNNDVFSISGLYNCSLPENISIYGGSFSASVAKYAADTLNFEVDRGDGWFTYFSSADEALAYAGDASGVRIKGVGASAGLKNCTVSVSGSGQDEEFTRVMPEGFTFNLPEAPVNGNRIFIGWQSAVGTYDAGETVVIRGDAAFHPVWAALPNTNDSGDEADESYAPELEYVDVSPDDWFFDAVEYVSSCELMNGVGDNCFAPDMELSRAMIWTVLARASGVETDGGVWYAEAREWAMENGISDGEAPGDSVTREQLVTMLYRLAGEPEVGDDAAVSSMEEVSVWALDAMTWALSEGVIEGDENGETYPSVTATRAQTAAILMRWASI